MAKETTYQRLKRENQELRQQLREVCINPTSMKSIQITARQQIFQKREDVFLMGSGTSDNRGNGLVDFIKEGGIPKPKDQKRC